jgi:hypothetical protein
MNLKVKTSKNGFISKKQFLIQINMDQPFTRRETKKDQKEKGRGKDGKYSQKHVRNVGMLKSREKTTSK